MPGFKGKRKWGLILTLYKKTFRYRLPVSPPRKRTKTSSNTPNLKSPSIRTPSLLKNLFQFQNIYILSNGFPHLFGVEDPVKMSLSCLGPDINRMKRSPINFLFSLTKKIGELMANISFDVIHLCQTILQCPKTTPMVFKGNFPFCTNLKNFNSLSFFPTSESLSRTS